VSIIASSSKVDGVVIGIVVDVNDPDGRGQIKLKFPWLGDMDSMWAPLATPLAGENRGMWFMPEIDDEALVAFEHGDFAHPRVIGFLWNGKDTPPETEVQNRIIKTPGGHELRFEDKAGSKKVILKTDGGLKITMDDNDQSIEIVGGGRAVTMKSGQVKIT
jgi:uncharacterized protein involved in type VI secretion and phage assembly